MNHLTKKAEPPLNFNSGRDNPELPLFRVTDYAGAGHIVRRVTAVVPRRRSQHLSRCLQATLISGVTNARIAKRAAVGAVPSAAVATGLERSVWERRVSSCSSAYAKGLRTRRASNRVRVSRPPRA
jgi:hypothetical protein